MVLIGEWSMLPESNAARRHSSRIVEHYPPDTTACIFWLKNRQPERWRDRVEVQHQDGRIGVIGRIPTDEEWIVGGISIMNIMLVSVSERTREIGLRMAVGARCRDIRRQFLIEATVLALLGGGIGVAIGSAAAVVVAFYSGWPVLISPWVVALACGFSTLVGLIFGAYPAHRAARLDPMVALRYE